MNTPPVACTIVSNNYLAYARVFTRSFLEQHPGGKVYVLLVDRPDPALRYEAEPFEAVFVESLGIPGFPHYSFRYSILELNTAVKPWFLLHLHRTGGHDRICYFDPDILVTGDLSPIYGRLGTADAVLTPHVTAPIEDDRTPSERDFLLSGMYNLGFLGIAFNERTLPYLDWWHRRLYKECLHEVERGLFVDQRWMDFAPSFLPHAEIWRDLGCNVAYWNLMHRSLSRRDGAWWVGDAPLRFFHFSGYQIDKPELISKYQNRFVLGGRPDLEELFGEYGRRIDAEGHRELQKLPYRFGCFDDGTPVPHLARVALRQVDPEGRRWSDPFATGPGSFLSWMSETDDPRAEIHLPRLALFLWDQRPDLQQAFPRVDHEDRARFAEWFAHGAEGKAFGEVFTRPVAESLRRVQHLPQTQVLAVRQRVASAVHGDTPFSADLPPEEISWLTADAGHEPGRRPRLPRMAMMLHQRRADLRGSFPDPLGADRERYAIWYATYGRQEYQLPYRMVAPVLGSLRLRKAVWAQLWWQRQRLRRAGAAAPPAPSAQGSQEPTPALARAAEAGPARLKSTEPAPSLRPGLNVVGWASAPTGVGEACRGTLHALAEAGVHSALWNLGTGAADDPRRGGREGMPFDVTLFHVNADMMPVIARQLPRSLQAGRYRVGYWFWELAHLPLAFADSFRHLDELWAPTGFCLDAFRAISPIPLRRVPPCVPAPAEKPAGRQELAVPDGSFLFYFAFDALSIPDRKNPEGLLRAFARAVRDSPRPLHLVLKVNHIGSDPALARRLIHLISDLPVSLLTDPMSRAEVNSLMAACDAYVSLHRSEGLGLPLIEGMYLGRPVIATGYGGVTDFFDDTTGWVVRHTLTALEEARGPYPAGAVWADPDPEHAAELMLQVATSPETAAAKAEAARRRVAELYSPPVAAERLRRELERIRSRSN